MRRILKWVALGAAGLLVVFIGVLLTLPLLLDSEAVKTAAVRHLSRATGGQWRLADVELSWFPSPKLSVLGASFSIPGGIEGKAERLSLTTALLPLLWGDIRLSRAALIAPDLTIAIASTSEASTASAPFTVSDLRAALAKRIPPEGGGSAFPRIHRRTRWPGVDSARSGEARFQRHNRPGRSALQAFRGRGL